MARLWIGDTRGVVLSSVMHIVSFRREMSDISFVKDIVGVGNLLVSVIFRPLTVHGEIRIFNRPLFCWRPAHFCLLQTMAKANISISMLLFGKGIIGKDSKDFD
ncbi:uncharacterized protein LOC131176505 [Hevea brasiliensis]|uniref:uncharacterized protein LOC131176505 n=1 Tax=Hevea brasiliensis TaxID=3981 RepID=UPI0025D062F8|nr:uncharacterized protein LOC131176505 [Hevea brasiliensis]